MFNKTSCNMNQTESYIRFVIASALLTYAVLNSSIVFSVISLFIYYSAVKKFCLLYHIFHINEKYGLKNYYLALLPKYRTSPVFIFNDKSKIIFSNESAKEEIPNIQSLTDLNIDNQDEFIDNGLEDVIMYRYRDKHYQVELKGISQEKIFLAYFTDVTELIELNEAVSKAIEETQREIIYAMGEIGETRSKETGNHVKRVALYSKELARLYGLSEEESERLQMASPMHDIGKVGIPDAILNAPRKLTFDEFKIMKTHAQLGYEMLKSSNKPILKAASIVANEHHEKWDGSGYPNGTSGEDIHIYGRITAIADVFDALGSERVYKKAWELDDILELFKQESGKHFDPKLILLFIDNLDKFLLIRDKYID
ncbi:HD domain-containing protein [Sulfurimonas aquatica]|uniref:HD domain-containing protein n=1 Tax=Sulfurimonas aquatica TaxID=2672570 RepID=A0A975GBS1_9BACT|nr:HD domain-containing protein [Sulfurimonas aquatica]